MRYGDKELKGVDTNAVDENYPKLMNVELLEGRKIEKADNDARANVCVISEDVRDTLFPTRRALAR